MKWLIIVLTFSIGGRISAQSDSTGSVRGIVYDKSDGESLPGVLILVINTQFATSTDINGLYTISKLPAGTYAVCARVAGYFSDTQQVVIKPNSFTRQTFLLNADPRDTVIYDLPPPDSIIPYIKTGCPSFSGKRQLIVAGTETVLAGASLVGLSQLWYKGYPHSSFHMFNDNSEWMQMDKIGHMQTAYTTGFICTHLWYWTGMNRKKAVWIGGLTGFAYQGVIEVMDGYSVGWGFSFGDIVANATGSALFISQELLWHDQRIQPKFGFRQSGYADYRPNLLGSNYVEQLLKDYNGQTYWLSVNVGSFLKPESRFPKWLNVAFGYGANGMTGGDENPVMFNAQGNEITLPRYRQYYLSFDIDLRKLPVKSRVLRTVFTAISFIKIPAPGIEVGNGHVHPLLFAF